MQLRSIRRLMAVILVAVPLSGSCSDADGDAAPAGQRVDRADFPGDSAYALLERQVAFGPRIPGQDGHARQLVWMKTWLSEHADTLVVQDFTAVTSAGDSLQLTNLIARFQPERADRVLLLTHWDTRPLANESNSPEERLLPVPGANDGASGTAILLQLARMFAASPPPVGVDLLFVDGEDWGPGTEDMFFGAKYFAANKPQDYRPLYGVLLDMVGDSQLQLPIEVNSSERAPEVVQRVWSVARDLGYSDIFLDAPGPWVQDDHIPLNDAGIRTIDIIDFDYGPGNGFWHTPQDVPANTSAESLDVVGEVMAELIYRGG